jgi:hypothetical protein
LLPGGTAGRVGRRQGKNLGRAGELGVDSSSQDGSRGGVRVSISVWLRVRQRGRKGTHVPGLSRRDANLGTGASF